MAGLPEGSTESGTQGRAPPGQGGGTGGLAKGEERGRPRRHGRHRGHLEEARHLSVGPDIATAAGRTAAMPRGTSSPAASTRRWPASRTRRPRWWSSTSTPSTPTPPTWPDARAASPSAWPRSRCASRPSCERALDASGFAGVLAYSVREAIWLVREGVTDDAVMGYPTVDRVAPGRPARRRGRACPGHADGRRPRPPVPDRVGRTRRASAPRVAIDIDAGLRMGRSHVGPKRSPLYDAAEVVALRARGRSTAASRWSG